MTIGRVGGNVEICTGVSAQAYADPTYVVPPGGGRITSFSFLSGPGNAGQQLEFLILRPAGGINTYTVVGRTALVTLVGTPTGRNVESFPADIAVEGGDILGIWSPRCPLANAGQVGTGGHTFFTAGGHEPNVGDSFFFDGGAGTSDLNESANLAP